jgi:cell wall-associated NlpC family hydrolase
VRLRALGSAVCSISILAFSSASAAAATGAATAVSNGSSVGGALAGSLPATHAHKPSHHAPVTASLATSLPYAGPVYEKTSSGQVVLYQTATTASELKHLTGGVVGVLGEAKPRLLVPGHLARIVDGLAAAPMLAPAAVQEIVWAGNQIVGLPYIYGGGHASFSSPGYDCSGTVSFALHGARLLSSPEDSSELEGWGSHGIGAWVTVFTNPGHAYMTVAGLRLDTSAADDPSNQQGPRWRPLRTSNEGFSVRHPKGL